MSTTQNLIWVALPNGVKSDGNVRNLQVSVFVNPRLCTDEGTTLALFPDFLNWADIMQPNQLNFNLEVDDGTQIKQVPAAIVSNPPNSALWQTFFNEKIPVRPYDFKEDDFSNRPIVSFPVKQTLGYLKKMYQRTASYSPLDLPPKISRGIYGDGDEYTVIFRELVDLIFNLEVKNEESLSQQLNDSLEAAKSIARDRRASGQTDGEAIVPRSSRVSGEVQDNFYRTMLFHYRSTEDKTTELPQGDEARTYFEKEIDFHQMLSALGDYPEILRRLGLIIDLNIPADALPKVNDNLGKSKLRVVPAWTSSFPIHNGANQTSWTEDYSPWTVYDYRELFDVELFTAHSLTGEIYGGVWTPQSGNVDLVQVDVDGAALKALNLAGSLARGIRDSIQAIDSEEKIGVPTLRTGGISVMRSENASHFNNIFNRSAKINQMLEGNPPILADLYAEDLTRGYRLDVIDETEIRHSLHLRIGRYKTLSAPGLIPDIVDEGFIQPSVTSSTASTDPVRELYLHESLFTWDGWSLSAPRPSKSISRTSRAPSEHEPETLPQDVNNTAMTLLGLETTFNVKPETLPRLRFGRGYVFRVRTVDLAGNGPTIEEVGKIETALGLREAAVGYLRYLRYEPINPPELVPRQLYSPSGNPNAPDITAYTEGESLERLVIRSNFDKTTEEYSTDHPAYEPFSERHIAAPKTSLQLVETHGLLDEALDAKKSGMSKEQIHHKIMEVYELAKRESGSLNDPSPSVRFISTDADNLSTESYAVHTEDQLILPYLPDPWASGVVFQGLPGLDPEVLIFIKYEGDSWHEAQPFRLRLVEGANEPVWDQETHVLTVQLPKSSIAHFRVSSMFGGYLEDMGLWQWLMEDEDITSEKIRELESYILDGRHWMFTPFRDITLVHAVQQPMAMPVIDRLEVNSEARSEGSTAAYLTGAIYIHAPSTSKLDMYAEWTERCDDPAKDLPNCDDPTKDAPDSDPVNFSTHVMELPVTLDNGTAVNLGIDEFPDALRIYEDERLVFNAEEAKLAQQMLQEKLEYFQGYVTEKSLELQRQINLASKVAVHQFGDTKYRHVRYRVTATSRFREYFTQSLWDKIFMESEEFEIDILSSARPAAPRVLYVLPTFQWNQTTDEDGKIKSLRSGGSLRVYLDRPWWSSGDGEKLAMVLGYFPDREDPRYSYSSFWGQDPIWLSPGLPLPKSEDYNVYQVKLSELEDTYVDVAVFDVHWDCERKLWYSDIKIAGAEDAYYPFIRLALARFQPNSLVLKREPSPRPYLDLRLSSVVLADFVQTAPNRAVTIRRTSSSPDSYIVQVSGVTYSAKRSYDNSITPATSKMIMNLQYRAAEIEDEILGWNNMSMMDVELDDCAPDAKGVVIWTGQVTIPAEYRAFKLRLVVREYEILLVPDTSFDDKRLVYVDTIPL